MPEIIVRKWDLPLTYEIFKEYGVFKARRGDTAEVQFEDSRAYDVLQAAIDALPQEGGRIFLKRGVYDITSTLKISDKHVVLEGEGISVQYKEWGTVLRKAFDGTLVDINYTNPNASGFTIRNLHFEGQKDRYTGAGLSIQNAKGWLIENVIVRNFNGSNISIKSCGWHRMKNVFCGSSDTNIIYVLDTGDFIWYAVEADTAGANKDAVIFENCKGALLGGHFEAGTNGRYGIGLTAASRMQLIGVWVGFCPQRAINAYNTIGSIIAGCRIYNNTLYGIFVGSLSSDVIIVANNIEDPGGYGMNTAIRLDGSDCRVIANRIADCTGTPIIDNGTGNIIKHNTGFITENSGSETGTGAQQAIPHGCNFTPTKAQVLLSNIDDGANPYLSADPDGTYIYVTAVSGKEYRWEVKRDP